VAVSDDLAGKVVSMGVPERRVHHIPHGVDTEKFSPGERGGARTSLGLSARARIVLAVGGLLPVKAFDRLIMALNHLEPDVLLVIAGEGPERKRLSAVAAATGISERVRLAGAVPHEFLPNFFRAADVLAISSHSEGWPTVIHEAFSCGTPVVANAVGGIPEALGKSGLGVLVDGNSPERLARGIAGALATQWDGNVISRHAGLYSWTRIANRYMALFENVIEDWARAKQAVG
jgi:glycosyltransferase involved in cell wall biosynthesis